MVAKFSIPSVLTSLPKYNTVRIVKTPHPLKSYRTQHNLSREELAAKLGCSPQLIQLIECDHRRITPEKAVQWSPILGISRAKLCPDIFGRPSTPSTSAQEAA